MHVFRHTQGRGSNWDLLNDYPSAIQYRADRTTNPAGAIVTRYSAGLVSGGLPMAYSAIDGKLQPLDGMGITRLKSGRLLLAGGAPQGHAADDVNTIWYSDDEGKTWGTLLADGNHPGWVFSTTHSSSLTRPEPMHTFGFFPYTYGGVDYVYWLGGDPFLPSGRVFRINQDNLEAGGDPSSWELVTSSAPTSDRALWMTGVLAGAIFIIGGQSSIENGNSKVSSVYKSVDGGATWTTDAAWDCPATVWGMQLGLLPVKDGKLWVFGSGRYDDTPTYDLSSAVYTFDGSTWTQVLADGHGQFPKHRYHSASVDVDGTFWIVNGTTYDGVTLTSDTRSVHCSKDSGVTWQAWPSSDPADLPWGGTHAQSMLIGAHGPLLTNGFETSQVYQIESHTGRLISTLKDLGSQGLDLMQGVPDNQPILVTSGPSDSPEIAFTRGQYMRLATPKRGLANAVYVACFVGRSRTYDASTATSPNAPCTIFGTSDGSSWNSLGLTVDTLTITGATNAGPIVVTVDAAHRLRTGDRISIHGVEGNRAAVGDWTVTVLSSTTFSLDGSTGSGAYTSGGTARVARARYAYFDVGLKDIVGGSWLDDGKKHVVGVVHTASNVALWVDGVKVAEQAAGFDTSWIGFDSIGAGAGSTDAGQFALGTAFVLSDLTAAPPDSFWSKVQARY